MARKSVSLLSSLAVLACASAPSHAAEPAAAELLRAATRAAAPLTRCQASAEDLVGEVALRLWSKHPEVLRSDKLRRYVEASVRNAWRDRLRRPRSTVFSDLAPDGEVAPAEPPAAAAPEAGTLASAAEFREGLRGPDREVLHHLEAGDSAREIARRMKKSRHWVRSAVQRIRERARRHLGT